MTDEHARVRCYHDDKTRINERRQGSETQADVIQRLLDGTQRDTDPITHDDLVTPADAVEIAAEVTDELAVEPDVEAALADVGASLTYDDVVAACRAAVREELPVEDLAR